MLQTVEQESLLLYLLNELGEDEREQIEQRYFADTGYFEDLLKLEEGLIEEYNQENSSPENPVSNSITSESSPEELPELRFAQEWTRGVVELKPLSGWERPAVSAGYYETELRKAKLAIREQETERLLAQAWADRQLVSALMDADWSGLRILKALSDNHEKGMNVSTLVSVTNGQIDPLVSLLVRLVQFGAVEEYPDGFLLTQRGAAVIKNLGATSTHR